MHGHKRDEYKARLSDPKVSAALAQKAQQWNTLSKELLERKKSAERKDQETLALTEQLLLVNPDPLQLWNHRRELLLHVKDSFHVTSELSLTAKALERNPKAYGAWFHRKWALRHYIVTRTNNHQECLSVLNDELTLCALFLSLDERNFHGWNYRRFVVSAMMQCIMYEQNPAVDGSWQWPNPQLNDECTQEDSVVTIMGAQLTNPEGKLSVLAHDKVQSLLQAEWDFTTLKIQQNFSNGSAFHSRSKLLPLRMIMLDNSCITKVDLAKEELELVHNAIFTEPDDQTAWWYHRFLLVDWLDGDEESIYLQEQEILQELIETEDGKCKWAWLGLLTILNQLQKLGNDVHEQQTECLHNLIELDPDRAERYKSLIVK